MDSDIPLLTRILGKFKNNSEDEIISMINESTEKGELRESEANMIHNVFEFDDKEAKDIMTHRGDIFAIDGNVNLREAIDLFIKNNYSRIPVYLEDLDNIIGIIHMRSLFEFSFKEVNLPKKIKDIEGIMYEPKLVVETHNINTLFTMMQKEKIHLVIVKDEYGQTSGLVTMEDIIEEIFGNIFDESDKVEESIIDRGNGVYIMFGKTELSEVSKRLPLLFNDEENETLNGFIISKLERIPQEHETFTIEYEGYSFKVMDVKDNMIMGVRVQRIIEETTKK